MARTTAVDDGRSDSSVWVVTPAQIDNTRRGVWGVRPVQTSATSVGLTASSTSVPEGMAATSGATVRPG